ncbi:unnamed protein product, partial [Ectocarpus sp. 12 AP-2014]
VNISTGFVNLAPVAEDRMITISEDGVTLISTSELASDPEGLDLVFQVLPTSINADITGADMGILFTYRPNPDFFGIDTFTYTVADPEGATDSGVITIEVLPVPDNPDAMDDSVTVQRGIETQIDVLFNDTDADNDSLTLIDVTDGSNGTVRIDGGSVMYLADAGDWESDSFTYTITDGTGRSDTASVFITGTGDAVDPPELVLPAELTVDENTNFVFDFPVVDASGAALSYQLSGVDAGRFVVDAASGVLNFTAPPDFEAPSDADANNIYEVTVAVTGLGGTATRSVAITIADVFE